MSKYVSVMKLRRIDYCVFNIDKDISMYVLEV